ncbi:MAG: adenylosuccinate synthase [Planctomycetota bacterium]|nr:MAG: adenylosuccinate synthase [Planctomycetota bacterium]
MTVTAIIGLQWGDEGKAKIVDVLSADADYVIRSQGGANAGHTVVADGKKYIFHLVPTGILHPGVVCVVGNGVVLDAESFFEEVDAVEESGFSTQGRIHVSDRCHLVMPYHRAADVSQEDSDGLAIGTTRRGIGPTYADKARRRSAIRVADLMSPDVFKEKLAEIIKSRTRDAGTKSGGEAFDFGSILAKYEKYRERLEQYVCDTVPVLRDAVAAGKEILLEGAQGVMLDVDFGTYPYVTSSNTMLGGAATGSSIPNRKIDRVVGIAKAYTTRVGGGPFPTELLDDLGKQLREAGGEYGATTGRPRRCGWIDLVALRYSTYLADVDEIALTKLDVLSGLKFINVCTEYEIDGERVTEFPASAAAVSKVRPVYETMPGWDEDLSEVRRFEDLPQTARDYVSYLEKALSIPVGLISVGPAREAMFETGRGHGSRPKRN